MSFNYECDFNLQAQRLTPITKRQDVRLGLLQSISEPIQWNRDNFFDEYLEGDSSAVWDAGTNYSRYDRVNYQNRIYECTNDIIAELPTNTDYWVLVVGDFRGATERIKYNCQKIMLEWILNKWFAATFRQPSTGLDSDFYIVSNDRDGEIFYVSEESLLDGVYQPSSVSQFGSGAEDFVGESSIFTASANFTVYYPVATIPLITDEKYYQMTGLINKYKIAGSTVEYVSY
jgi:hypothetical protein